MARAKLLTAARETNCGVWSSKPSAGDFTLKRFPFTHCPFHQSEGPPESRHPEQLPSDPASGCWFILFGHFGVDGAAFDRSGSRTWMRSLAKTAREGEFHSSRKDSSYPWLVLRFQYYTHIAGEVVIFIETCGKWPISGGKEGPFMQSQFHQADRNSSIPLFMQLCPPIKLHQPSRNTHASSHPSSLLRMCQEPQIGLPLTGENGRGKETCGGT